MTTFDDGLLLAMDVGNTQTTAALFQRAEIVQAWRLTTARHRTKDEWGALFQNLFHFHGVSFDDVKGVAVSSVVPPLDMPLRNLVRHYFGRDPLFVQQGIKTGIAIHYDNPAEVGADRIVNAVSTAERYGVPAVVVDFGTATTFDVLGHSGAYEGGIIAPGIGISAEALFEKAAKLPKVDLCRPDRFIGRTTAGAIRSGLYWGYAGLVEGIARRLLDEMGGADHIVATGGHASVLAGDCPCITDVDENLTLHGLRILYGRNAGMRDG